MPSDARSTRRYLRRWLCGLGLLAAVLGVGLVSPAAASTSALPIADTVVDLEETVQPRRARVARRSVAGHRAFGTVRERSTVRWLRPVVRALCSLRSARPRSTRGPPLRLASA